MSKDYNNFDPFSVMKTALLPSTIGFDGLFKSLEDIAKVATSYPPYNIKKVSDTKYVIELAVAGFGKQDIDIEFLDGTLVIKGNTTLDTLTKDGVDVTYLHKGIAERAFTRTFKLADTVEIKNAELINGILKVWFEAFVPEKKARKIDIKDENTKSDSQLLTESSPNGYR